MPAYADSTMPTNTTETNDYSDSLSSAASTLDSLDNLTTPLKPMIKHKIRTSNCKFSNRSQLFWRGAVIAFAITVLLIARYNMPDNPVQCVEDKVMNSLQPLNDWIHVETNAFYRNILAILCASQIDLICITTFLHWVIYGKTGRLPMTLLIFYTVRALVQTIWWSPYPSGFYWESPGFPSFVAPYGKASDFFYSGHTGFLVVMANEWNKNGKKTMRNYCLVNLVYTAIILLIYRVHYSIDIFTGVFFADYVFGKVDRHKEIIDGFWKKFARKTEYLAQRASKMISGSA